MNFKKRILPVLLAILTSISISSCGGDVEINLSYTSYDTSGDESTVSSSSVSEDTSRPEIEDIPSEKKSHTVMDDDNYYIKVQTVNGNKTCIREFASKGKDAYANLSEGEYFEWFYSNGNGTFSFDDENKTFELYSWQNLFLELFSDTIVERGECKFFDVECNSVKYKFTDTAYIIHLYRKSDGSWIGFQYMYNDQFEEANIILEASEEFPAHIKFGIPEDYVYIHEKGDNEVSIDWS